MGFFGPVSSFPIIPVMTPHRGEGALVCSHERQLGAGTETRNVADVGCCPFPSPGRDLPLWGRAAAAGGIIPRWELLLLSLPHSFSLKPGFWATCCWSPLLCLFLGRQISYRTFPHTFFKFMTAAPLLPLSH